MDKSEAYARLFRMPQTDPNVERLLRVLAASESTPYEVSEYLSNPDQDDFSELLDRKKPYFKSIMKLTLDDLEYAKAISSMITHQLIDGINLDNSKLILRGLSVLQSFVNGSNLEMHQLLNELRDSVK